MTEEAPKRSMLQRMIGEATVSFKKALPLIDGLREKIFDRYFKGVKVPKIPAQLSGKVARIERGGRYIKVAGHRVRLTNSRSKITLKGKSVKRGALKVGHTCDIVGGMRKGKYEGRKIACR